MIAVADASPLCYLVLIGEIDLSEQDAEKVFHRLEACATLAVK